MKRTGNGVSSYIYRIKQLEKENNQLKNSSLSPKKYKKMIRENKKIKGELMILKNR